MPGQQVCSPTYQRGFISVAGNLSLQSLTTQSNISPFTASFAPRNVAPGLYTNFVDETAQNTIMYNSYRYTLLTGGTQFCKPTHTGLNIGTSYDPALELIFAFSTNQQIPVSDPKVILLVIPIYNIYENKHSAYVRQFIDSDKYPAASIQTIFFDNKDDKTQSSISYNSSVQLVDSNRNPVECINMKVFYFPNGMRVAGQEFANFMSILTQAHKSEVPDFMFPWMITSGNQIVLRYDQLTNKITEISTKYNVPVSQLTVADVGNKLEYFKLPMSLSGTKDFSSSCPAYKTDQYKCVPFHRLKDLSGNEVIKDANTLADVLKTQDETNGQGQGMSGLWGIGLVGVLAIFVVVAVVIILLGMLVRYLGSAKPPGAAAATVAVAAAATAATTAPVAASAAPSPTPAPANP